MLELVAVLAVILILAGLLLPVISRARNRALRVAAQTEVKQIESAWGQYFAEYQTWPSNFDTCAITNEVLWILEGSNVWDANRKSISFMHFTRINTSSNPISPWGNKRSAGTSNDYYYCRFDTNYDQVISFSYMTNTTDIRRSVIVWTYDQKAGTNDPDYIIGSWK
jgi:type II secretory pathway pseudopilin PulG